MVTFRLSASNGLATTKAGSRPLPVSSRSGNPVTNTIGTLIALEDLLRGADAVAAVLELDVGKHQAELLLACRLGRDQRLFLPRRGAGTRSSPCRARSG